MANHYVNSVAYTAVAQWAASTAFVSTSNGGRGDYVRQTAPAVGSERVFRCTTSGTSNTVEPTWVLTRNATTPDTNGTGAGNVVWTECTGQEADQVVGTWKAPHARFRTVVASGWMAAGDTCYFSSNHNATQSTNLTITSLGTAANPCNFLCVTSTLPNVPPLTGDLVQNGGQEQVSGAAITWTTAGNFYAYGLKLGPAPGAGSVQCNMSNGNNYQCYEQCTILGTANNSSALVNVCGGLGSKTEWINTNFTGAAGAQPGLYLGTGDFAWRGGSLTTDQTLVSIAAGDTGTFFCEGVDFTAQASGRSLVVSGNAGGQVNFFFNDCSITSGVTVATPAGPLSGVHLSRTDTSGTNNEFAKYNYFGTSTSETTITRAGGSAAPDGTLFSKKLVTTANAKWQFPFKTIPFLKWNTAVSPTVRTVTVYGTINAGSPPNTDDIWIEVLYSGTAASTKGSYVTSTKANILATGSAYSADGSTWNGGGSGAGWSPFVMTVTFTAQVIGPVIVVVKVGKASTTYYVDPTAYFS